MKRIATLLGIAALVVACSKEAPAPTPEPTPLPVATAVPLPTVVPTNPPIVPCKATGIAKAYQGDCQVIPGKCRNGSDGFYYGTCKTVGAP